MEEELKTTNKELKEREDVFQTKMKEVEAQIKELKERVKVIEEMEEELKTKNKELKEREDVVQTKMEKAEAQNKELRERIKVMEVTQVNVGCISSGIGGGKEGAYWAYKADGPIMLISFQYANAIDSIIFQSKIGGKVGRSVKIGGSGGHTLKTFSIDSSVEQISSINLTYEEYCGEVRIVSLGFETNVGNKYGPVGLRMGTSSVSIPIEGGDFAGFHGRVGTFLTAIGVLVAPKHPK
ncbi:mannose/glucose-specific lectin-like [Rhododendron vialii]|uniref:mannose/glucose-specific lectin-like n=1 Tax=Rhododendron vialii TaxID=182163 RepID=UPI00265FF0FF|nr:mannose/glucose-specific lectin-like [Rhododendron vialii]